MFAKRNGSGISASTKKTGLFELTVMSAGIREIVPCSCPKLDGGNPGKRRFTICPFFNLAIFDASSII